jgi:hypothetical protein
MLTRIGLLKIGIRDFKTTNLSETSGKSMHGKLEGYYTPPRH